MNSYNFPHKPNNDSLRHIELTEQGGRLWRDLYAKTNNLERQLRGVLALIVVYLFFQIYNYLKSSNVLGGIFGLIFIAAIGLNLLLARQDVIKMKAQMRELKSVMKEGELLVDKKTKD